MAWLWDKGRVMKNVYLFINFFILISLVITEETVSIQAQQCPDNICTTRENERVTVTESDSLVVQSANPLTFETTDGLTIQENAMTSSTVRQNETFSGTTKTVNVTSQSTSPPTTVITPSAADDSLKLNLRNKTNEPCSCDQIEGECEVNCCCDPDCDSTDISVFSHCRRDKPSPPSDYCLTTDIIYRNTTVYSLTQSENRLFCVDTHNIPHSLKLYNQKVVQTEDGFKNLIKQKKVFKWQIQNIVISQKSIRALDGKPYKFGTPIIKYTNESSTSPFSYFSLPIEGTTSMCGGREKVRYLENFESSCLVKKPRNDKDCEGNEALDPNYFCQFQIISSPSTLNKTVDIENNTLKLNLFHCTVDDCRSVSQLPSTVFNKTMSKCENMVKSVKFVFKHNGTKGIIHGGCYVETVSIAPLRDFMRIHFFVDYEWAKDVKDSFPRSGRPGYLPGKPIISGKKSEEKDKKGKDIILFSKNPTNWIKTLWTSNGICSSERRHIFIGENIKSQCLLEIPLDQLKSSKDCSKQNKRVLEMLLGVSNVTEVIWFSSWGDPDLTSWAPLILTSAPPIIQSNKCLAFASSLHIRIITAYVGPVQAPQLKLVGTKAEVETSPLSCDNEKCNAILVTTVTFTDSTPTPVAMFSKPPIIRFHLPHDFFYPFSIGSNAHRIQIGENTIFLIISVEILLKQLYN